LTAHFAALAHIDMADFISTPSCSPCDICQMVSFELKKKVTWVAPDHGRADVAPTFLLQVDVAPLATILWPN
jgi:hypothetical protein